MEKMIKNIMYAVVVFICCIFDSSAMINNQKPTQQNGANIITTPTIQVNPSKIQERLKDIFSRLEKQLTNLDLENIKNFTITPCHDSWISMCDSTKVLEELIKYVNRQSSVYPKSKALFDRTIVNAPNAIASCVYVSDAKEFSMSNMCTWNSVRVDGRTYGMYVTLDR